MGDGGSNTGPPSPSPTGVMCPNARAKHISHSTCSGPVRQQFCGLRRAPCVGTCWGCVCFSGLFSQRAAHRHAGHGPCSACGAHCRAPSGQVRPRDGRGVHFHTYALLSGRPPSLHGARAFSLACAARGAQVGPPRECSRWGMGACESTPGRCLIFSFPQGGGSPPPKHLGGGVGDPNSPCTWSTARATARLRDSRPWSSPTGQVIQGLR